MLAWIVDRRTGVASFRRGDAPSLLRDLSLIAIGLMIVSAVPLAAELHNTAMVRFTLALGGAVVLPYVVSRFLYRDRAIRFPWRAGGRWRQAQWVWLVAVLVLGWLLLPFYFITSGAYQNWPVVDSADLIARLFVGVGAVGIWDELFFICITFVLLRRHMPNWAANVLQAIVFVSFLWELGYREWRRRRSPSRSHCCRASSSCAPARLGYIVTVHLLFDAVVFAALVHAHNPGVLDAVFLVP